LSLAAALSAGPDLSHITLAPPDPVALLPVWQAAAEPVPEPADHAPGELRAAWPVFEAAPQRDATPACRFVPAESP
jgi:hypothetical protein